MDLAALETNVTSWVEGVSGLTLHWRRQPPKAIPFPYIEAELLAIRGKGHDEKLWSHDHITDEYTLTLTGVRAFTLSIAFLSRSQKLGQSARQYSEWFRTRAYSESSIETLGNAGLALTEILGVIDADFTDESGRLVSQTSIDMLFEMRSSLVDTSYTGGYIKKVDLNVDGYVYDEYGNLVLDEDGNPVVREPELIGVVEG